MKHVVQCGIWVPTLAFAIGPRKITENLDRVGRSQDLPDANLLLASSPAINTPTLTLVPMWPLLYLNKKRKKENIHICFAETNSEVADIRKILIEIPA
jgi:hypothetical protein